MPNIRLPDDIAALVDEHRGAITRTQYVTNVLAAHLGIEAPVLLRGRPRKTLDESTDPTDALIEQIARIARDDTAYRNAWYRRVQAAVDALEAMGLMMDAATRERIVREQHEAFPAYHPR